MIKLNRLVSAIAAGSVIMGAASSSVQAGDFRGRGYHAPRYVQPYHARPYHVPRQHYGYDNHRRHDRNKIAKGVAIGAAALILGTIIASEANRRHRYRY